MKTYLKLAVGAVLIGGLFAYLFYRDIKSEVSALTNSNNELYLFQVGVFKNEVNATDLANTLASKIIYHNDEYYRVFTCLTTTEENKDKLKKYYDKKGIEYFVKKIKDTKMMANDLNNYEQLLNKTNEDDVINKVCQSSLDTFLNYYGA